MLILIQKLFYIALNELYNEQVIINTTKKSTYVVNHNYIFRGSMTDFIKIIMINMMVWLVFLMIKTYYS